MTRDRRDEKLPGRDALIESSAVFGLDGTAARCLHERSNAVYLLGNEVVARLAPDTPLRRQRARSSIDVTRWLGRTSELAVAPLPGEQPVIIDGAVATFWPYRPTETEPTLADLGSLLRQLHAQDTPPFPLPDFDPLRRLREALDVDQRRTRTTLSAGEQRWIHERAEELSDQLMQAEFPLGRGLIHADASTGNLVAGPQRGWQFIDWDNVCHGPREFDLASGLPDHFDSDRLERADFLAAYGYRERFPSWELVRDITELRSIGAYIRLAATKPDAADELRRRVRSLRTGNRSVRWYPTS